MVKVRARCKGGVRVRASRRGGVRIRANSKGGVKVRAQIGDGVPTKVEWLRLGLEFRSWVGKTGSPARSLQTWPSQSTNHRPPINRILPVSNLAKSNV